MLLCWYLKSPHIEPRICPFKIELHTQFLNDNGQKDGDNPVNQSKLEVITRSRYKERENVHARATIGFGFTSDWLKKWRENLEPITE